MKDKTLVAVMYLVAAGGMILMGAPPYMMLFTFLVYGVHRTVHNVEVKLNKLLDEKGITVPGYEL